MSAYSFALVASFGNLQSRTNAAPASTRREPSFAVRGTIAAMAGDQNMAPIAHANGSLGSRAVLGAGYQALDFHHQRMSGMRRL